MPGSPEQSGTAYMDRYSLERTDVHVGKFEEPVYSEFYR